MLYLFVGPSQHEHRYDFGDALPSINWFHRCSRCSFHPSINWTLLQGILQQSVTLIQHQNRQSIKQSLKTWAEGEIFPASFIRVVWLVEIWTLKYLNSKSSCATLCNYCNYLTSLTKRIRRIMETEYGPDWLFSIYKHVGPHGPHPDPHCHLATSGPFEVFDQLRHGAHQDGRASTTDGCFILFPAGSYIVVTWLCTLNLGLVRTPTSHWQTYEADLNFPLVLVPSNPADERHNLKGMIATECLSIFRNLKHQLSWKSVGCSWWRIRKRTCKRKGKVWNPWKRCDAQAQSQWMTWISWFLAGKASS